MKAPLTYVPALPVVLGWIAGILFWRLGLDWWAAAIAVAGGIALMLRQAHWLSFGLYAVGGGWLVAWLCQPAPAPEGLFDGIEHGYVAEVVEVSSTPDATQMVVMVDSLTGMGDARMQPATPFRMMLTTPPTWMPPAIGTLVRYTARARRPRGKDDFPAAIDYTDYYLSKGVVATAYISSDPPIREVGYRSTFGGLMARQRAKVVSVLARAGLSQQAFGMLSALLVGCDDDLAYSTRETFRATGIAHALVLSGFHLGVVVWLASLALYPLRFWPRLRKLRIGMSLLLVWAYCALVGMPDSVVRAGVMVSVYGLARLLERPANTYNALCGAVLVILAVSPYSLFSAGLQLSVGAVLGIVAFAPVLNPVAPTNHGLHTAVAALTVPIGAVAGTAPVALAVFHTLPAMFLVANLAAAVLLPPLMFFGVIRLAGSWAGFELGWLDRLLDALCGGFVSMAEALSDPAAALRVDFYLHPLQIAVLAAAIAAAGFALNLRRRGMWIFAGVMTACVFVVMPLRLEAGPESEMFAVHDQTGRPVVLRHGRSAAVSIDCQPERVEAARRRLARTLADYMALRRIDTLRVTTGPVDVGPFALRGDTLTVGGRTITLTDSTRTQLKYTAL